MERGLLGLDELFESKLSKLKSFRRECEVPEPSIVVCVLIARKGKTQFESLATRSRLYAENLENI